MKARMCKSLLLASFALAFTSSLLAQGAKDELAKMEGTWVGGVRSPAGKAKEGSATMVQISELTIKDGKITACKDGKGVSLGNCETLTLNPASKTLDATGDSKTARKESSRASTASRTASWNGARPIPASTGQRISSPRRRCSSTWCSTRSSNPGYFPPVSLT